MLSCELPLSKRRKRERRVWASGAIFRVRSLASLGRRGAFVVVSRHRQSPLQSSLQLSSFFSTSRSSDFLFYITQKRQAPGAALPPSWVGHRQGAGSSVRFKGEEREGERAAAAGLAHLCLLTHPRLFLLPLSSFFPLSSASPSSSFPLFAGWYPQLVTNFHTRSVAGFSLDNILLNFLGFACYSAYNGALFFSHSARSAYRHAHGGVNSDVRSNDVFFAFHALFCTVLTALQALRYDRGGQKVSKAAIFGCGAAALALLIYGALWLIGECRCVGLDLLRFLDCLSFVKVATTFLKYLPQIRLNASRKSTAGFNISNSITDLSGGLLSLSQQALDAWLFADITLVTVSLSLFFLPSCSSGFEVGKTGQKETEKNSTSLSISFPFLQKQTNKNPKG